MAIVVSLERTRRMASIPVVATPGTPGQARCLPREAIAKPWGRQSPGRWSAGLAGDRRIGEIIHAGPADAPLLVKTLFTSDCLSVQVHPDAAAARRLGIPCGKDEAWLVLDAEPGARIGLGLRTAADADTLRAAMLDGSILDLMCWHACAPGDVLFAPAGTIHAIGAGLTLFEVQQNCDVTWRLYDHGRPRPLHLDEGLAVARAGAWRPAPTAHAGTRARQLLVAEDAMVLERLDLAGEGWLRPPPGAPVWVAVIDGSGTVDGLAFAPGDVWYSEAPAHVAGQAELLLSYAGPGVRPAIWAA